MDRPTPNKKTKIFERPFRDRPTTSWTPVVAKRRKKCPVPQYMYHRFPLDHPIHVQNAVSDSDTDSGSDHDLGEMIPSEAVNVQYREIDGTPGLTVWTCKTRSWTPVAARTRSKLKQ